MENGARVERECLTKRPCIWNHPLESEFGQSHKYKVRYAQRPSHMPQGMRWEWYIWSWSKLCEQKAQTPIAWASTLPDTHDILELILHSWWKKT